MHRLPQLIEVGRSAAGVLRDEASWIHRRVESITFPFPDEPVYRRRISIDFSIPAGLSPIDAGVDGGRSPRYYVPLSILRKWPPLDRLDLLGEDGRPIPFLTGRQNQVLDAAVLVQMADDVAGDLALAEDQKRQVAEVALSSPSEAGAALNALCPPVSTHPDLDPALDRLRRDDVFMGHARRLCLHTILWLRTEGLPGDREIVKFAYDIPWELNVGDFDRAAFGLAPFVVEFDTPHVGATGSYHLNMAIPAPLRAVTSELVMFESQDAAESSAPIDPATIRHKATPGHPVRPAYHEFQAYTDVRGPRAKFYVAGKRDGLSGRVFVGLKLEVTGFLRSASLGALLLALVIAAFAAVPHHVMADNNNSAVAVLLIAPALLAYLLRPSEHVLVGGLLIGLRRLAVASGVLPLVAAVLVITLSSEDALRLALAALAFFEACTGIALALPLIQARRDLRAEREALPS